MKEFIFGIYVVVIAQGIDAIDALHRLEYTPIKLEEEEEADIGYGKVKVQKRITLHSAEIK
jgi:hypothetical protein